jgi:predicted transcriptional regulator YdeE
MAVALLSPVSTDVLQPGRARERSGDASLEREARFRLIAHGELWVVGVAGSGPFWSASGGASGGSDRWVSRLWEAVRRHAGNLPDSVDRRGFLCPHFGRETEFTYYVGYESSADVTDLPPGLVCIKIPAHTWAVGLVQGSDQIDRVYSGLSRWIEAQGYEEVPRALAIEAYPPDGPRPGDDLVFDVLLPVRRRPVAGTGRRPDWDRDSRRIAHAG